MAQSRNVNTPTKKLMMILMGGAGMVLLGGGGLIVGLNSKVTSLQTFAQQKEGEVGSSEQIARRYQTTLDAYTQTQSRIKFLEASVSAKSYVPTLLGQLQSLAAATHLTVMAVRPAAPPPPAPPAARPAGGDPNAANTDKKPAPPPPYDTINIDVDVTGTYADTATFLYSLTRFPKILSVTSAQMHPGAVPAGASPYASPTVMTNLKMVAFVFHDDGTDTPSVPATTLAQSSATPPQPDLMGHTDVSTISAAAGRAERGAVAATRASNERITLGNSTL